MGDVANNCLMRCVQLDGAHMKHNEYNGVAFVLEGSDANGKNMMLALGLQALCLRRMSYGTVGSSAMSGNLQ